MKRVCSVFRQILNVFSRSEFEHLARKHGAERHARGFTCWDQLVAMMFCHLGRAQSLREICGGLASAEGKLNHLGIDSAPARSTLAYANAHRPWQVYESLFYLLLERCRKLTPKRRLKFKNALLSLDSTVIDLCASVFDWAKFRTTKGGIKVHMLLDNQGLLPSYALITDAKTSDIRPAREMTFSPGTIVVFDRGYNDFLWFVTLALQGVWFVTRMKDGTRYRVVERREVPSNGAVLRDEVIELDVNLKPYDIELDSPVLFRRVEVRVPDRDEPMVFLTNHLEFAASTIAAIYKERWQVELLFKALKQNLRIKTFVGTSSNALHIQIWTALIAMLILRYLQLKSQFGWSLSNLLAMLRFNLFAYRDLWTWLDHPFSPPEPLPSPVQLSLA
ncbi:MAG TPA: IS4 family transposase [Thermoanaerobaculia bacterium]|nr:IS4 family transposase [Thermoanaerobaculia bacterium]